MDKQLLQELLNEGLTIRAIAEKVGITSTPVRYWMRKYGLKANYTSVNIRTWTDEELIEAVKTSLNKSDVLRKIGLQVRPGNYSTLNKYLEKLKIDISHFVGKTHGKGGVPAIPLKEVLVENSTYSRHRLKKRLLDKQLIENKCNECGLKPEWQDKPLIMVLDHINGINNDNRIENLRFLCPNCNSQQSTFCRKKKDSLPR